MTKRELEARVAALAAEVEGLKIQVQWHEIQQQGHICPMLPASQVAFCTCGQTAPCQVHPMPWHGQTWITTEPQWINVCAGGPGVVSIPAESFRFTSDLVAPGCAGNPAATMRYFTVDAS